MKKNHSLRLGIGFIGALVLSIFPLPEWLSVFRPPWVLLLVLYIEYYLPASFKLPVIMIAGLLLDVLLSSVIGEHSFALVLVTWVALSKSRRFQFFSMLQQICLIGFFCFLYHVIISLINALSGFNYNLLMPLESALSGMFIWPWLRLLGDSSFPRRLAYK